MAERIPLGELSMPEGMSAFATRVDAPPTEREIARDLARRAIPLAPILIAAGAIVWGVEGALSVAYALVLVVANFWLAAAIMTRAAAISLGVLMGAVMLGYVVRLGLVTLAVLAVVGAAWVEVVPLALTIVVAHLGLLAWEAKHVSASLAFPGLKPGTALKEPLAS